MKRAHSNPVDPSPLMARGETEFHVLFNADGGPVQECTIEASCFLECEEKLKREHPEATYWGIGF